MLLCRSAPRVLSCRQGPQTTGSHHRCLAPSGPHARRRVAATSAAGAQQAQVQPAPPANVDFKKLLLIIIDKEPYLGGGSKQAVATAAALSRMQPDSHITALVVDSAKQAGEEAVKTKMETVSWHLNNLEAAKFDVLEAARDASPAVLIGDMADQVDADLVVISGEAVHAKVVDANLLAEFVACPLLVLP